MGIRDVFTYVAKQIFFDNAGSALVSTDVEAAIKENSNLVQTSASPGFSWGKGGSSGSGDWLRNHEVPSNRTGIVNPVTNGEIVKIFASNSDINTFSIGIYQHDGDEINLTLLHTVTVTAARSGTFVITGVTVTDGKQLAARVTSGNANEVLVGIIIKGETS